MTSSRTRPSARFELDSRHVEVHGSRMHYVEEGAGPPILFVHGNPTSSYLWRNVIPHVSPHGRAIAVDLIGMGRSDKPALDYRFSDHLRYLDGFIEALGLEDVTLVVHDWGGGLGTSWARRQTGAVRGVAFMESVLLPIDWSDADLPTRLVFKRMRHPTRGDRMNKQGTFFLRWLMPMMTRNRLGPEVRARYAEPYPTPESRIPIAQWPREIPISGEPADMHAEITANYEWFRSAPFPKLLLHASPGVIFTRPFVARLEAEVEHLTSVHVGRGRHYIQEDVPDAIGRALAGWLQTLPGRAPS